MGSFVLPSSSLTIIFNNTPGGGKTPCHVSVCSCQANPSGAFNSLLPPITSILARWPAPRCHHYRWPDQRNGGTCDVGSTGICSCYLPLESAAARLRAPAIEPSLHLPISRSQNIIIKALAIWPSISCMC